MMHYMLLIRQHLRNGDISKMLSYFLNLFKNDYPPRDIKVFRELSMLTDRDLNDIGITRGQIDAVSRGWHPSEGYQK